MVPVTPKKKKLKNAIKSKPRLMAMLVRVRVQNFYTAITIVVYCLKTKIKLILSYVVSLYCKIPKLRVLLRKICFVGCGL